MGAISLIVVDVMWDYGTADTIYVCRWERSAPGRAWVRSLLCTYGTHTFVCSLAIVVSIDVHTLLRQSLLHVVIEEHILAEQAHSSTWLCSTLLPSSHRLSTHWQAQCYSKFDSSAIIPPYQHHEVALHLPQSQQPRDQYSLEA